MRTLRRVRKKVKTLSKKIEAPKHAIPTFGYSEQSGLAHIERTGQEYHYVVCERGSEFSRKTTDNVKELLFWIFDSITFSMACQRELNNRLESEDIRIQLFQIQEDLIAQIDKDYAYRLKRKHDKLLNEK